MAQGITKRFAAMVAAMLDRRWSMGEIIRFPRELAGGPSRRDGMGGLSGEIVIFDGVRYTRHSEESGEGGRPGQGEPRRGKRSRRRSKAQ